MKTIKTGFLLIIAFLMLASLSFAQGRHGGKSGGHRHRGNPTKVVVKPHRHAPNKRVVVRSTYRPAKMVVYHPHWGPNYNFHRRWVYFPRHNFYWDNWRQCYFFWNGAIWVNQLMPPPVVVNISTEKHYELKEIEDDVDDVYKTNETHKTELKTDTVK